MAEESLSWTMYGPLEEETSVLDPLGFDYFAQLLGNVVLPGFTSRTGRARYYGMVAYGIYICHEYLRSIDKVCREKEIMEAFKAYEKYWARAVVEFYMSGKGLAERDGKERELRGKRGAIKAYYRQVKTLDFPFLIRQLELGALGAYRSSMESLELLKPGLELTHKGRELAKSFVDTKRYDPMVIRAIREGKIVEKEGNQTLKSLGMHTCLDAASCPDSRLLYQSGHARENQLLKTLVLENPVNITANGLIYKNKGEGISVKNPMEILEAIAGTHGKIREEQRVINGFKTIVAFENLAVAINRVWCSLIRNAQGHVGSLSFNEAAAGGRGYLDTLVREGYIKKLMVQTDYRKIRESLHGPTFSALLQEFETMKEKDYPHFIAALIQYHGSVMKKRNSSPWLLSDGEGILVAFGSDYPQKTEKASFLHGYKVANIIQMIRDTGWIFHGRDDTLH